MRVRQPGYFLFNAGPIRCGLGISVAKHYSRRDFGISARLGGSAPHRKGNMWTFERQEGDRAYVNGKLLQATLPIRDSSEVLAARQRIRAHGDDPGEILDQCIRQGTATFDVLRVCLRAAFDDAKRLQRRQRESRVKQQRIGSIALHYLWTAGNEDMWMTMMREDREYVFILCYFALAEGHRDRIVQWLNAALPDTYRSQLEVRDQHVWRGSLFRALVSASAMLDTSHSADFSLRCFFHVVDRQESIREQHARGNDGQSNLLPPIALMSQWPATVVMGSILQQFAIHANTSPRLFDRFVKFRESGGKDGPGNKEFAMARLAILHPTRPSADLAVAFVRGFLSNTPTRLPVDRAAQAALHLFFEQVIHFARQRGLQELEFLERTQQDVLASSSGDSKPGGWAPGRTFRKV